MPGKSEAERNREEALQQTHTSLRMAKEYLEEALDWSRSWPNRINKLDEDLLSMITRLGTIITAVKPPDYVTRPYDDGREDGDLFNYADGEIIQIRGED